MPLTRYSERCWALTVFFVCVGNWFLCLNVCCLDAENVKSFVITHSITEKIPISPNCRLKTWKCWLITARYSWAESQGLVAELLRPACLVTVSLVWEPWPTLGWLDQTDDTEPRRAPASSDAAWDYQSLYISRTASDIVLLFCFALLFITYFIIGI